MCKTLRMGGSWQIWETRRERNQEGTCEEESGVMWGWKWTPVVHSDLRSWENKRAQPGPYCTYQSPWIPTFALGIIHEVINTSGTAFGYDFGPFLFLTWIWMKSLGLIALTPGHGALPENYPKWRWIKRGKLTASVRCKEVRHMHLHHTLFFLLPYPVNILSKILWISRAWGPLSFQRCWRDGNILQWFGSNLWSLFAFLGSRTCFPWQGSARMCRWGPAF